MDGVLGTDTVAFRISDKSETFASGQEVHHFSDANPGQIKNHKVPGLVTLS